MPDNNLELTPLERLAKTEIPVIAPVADKGLPFNVRGKELYFELPESAVLCISTPHYHGNRGFFHIKEGQGECLLLKNCYSDFTRVIRKGITLTNDALNNISRTLSQTEGLLEGLFEIVFFYCEGQMHIFEVNDMELPPEAGLDPSIPRPLNALEYSEPMTDFTPEKELFSRSLLQTVFPEQVSFFTTALFKKYPDILHPFFLIFDAKVGSPSAKCIDFRPYVNINGLLRGFREVKIDRQLFSSFYMPWQKIFSKDKPHKPELFISKRISTGDLEGFVEEIEKEYKKKGSYNIYEQDYFEPVVKITMMAMILNFLFQEQFSYFTIYIKATQEDALRWIYKTRESSFFIKGDKFTVPPYFDIALPAEEVEIIPSASVSDKNVIMSCLLAFSRRRRHKKAFALLESIHKILDLRDILLKHTAEYHTRTRKYILDNATYIVNKGKFKYAEQAFLFDTADLKRLTNDTFYTGLGPILEYRESLRRRAAAQAMPYEMYEIDIPYAGMITEDQYAKGKSDKIHRCESYNTAEISGKVVNFSPHADETAGSRQIYCARAFPLTAVAKLGKPQAVITDIAPAFSYITEYCMIHDIPLYSGVRHCELLLKEKKVKLDKNTIEVI